MKILIVDDERFNLKIAEGLLKDMSPQNEIILCLEPELVGGLIEENEIDIILLDIVMPHITGTELLKQIRSNKKYDDMQVVMLTSIGNSLNIMECFDLGANDYILKPINIIEFQARVNAAIRARENSITVKNMWETVKNQNAELKQMNEKLQNTQFHLIQSEKMAAIGELAAGVAHEINNPIGYVGSNFETLSSYLAKIQSYIDYNSQQIDQLSDKCPSAEIDQLKNDICSKYKSLKIDFITDDLDILINDSLEGIDRVSKIVKTLRNFARYDSDEQREYCSIREMVEEVLLIVRNEAKYSVNFDISEISAPEIWCHKGQFGQVLLNIIVNALQAIKSLERADFSHIKISSYYENGLTCISILDDGPGIPEDIKYKIFNPFFTTKDVGSGTGLGLSISYDIIVNKHGGTIDVISSPEEGTEFILKLPPKPEEPEV
ncbi:His Kinase A (phospho-acceptor) domain-containing protein [Peptoclostridium litorale DSM 5388]|uniref:Stage 0 sporulation protein A homolog n=1 Tax=Peptoclostridium litorale DSM 5388 TaxID=1121324 RepID=A0A069RBW5_PEPLI|nr:ATP-binding protein [Peptoclostridium litorale]KDR94559.1 ATP-binding protein [Peptoclostridium litorale DSM 5388]SIO31388.1 His Kinase A (phospho-acceptor) domain-containing protein [Peptoclostridium litorale DSM 5388]